MKLDLFETLSEADVIKFVILNIGDYNKARDLIRNNPNWKARKVFSPGFTKEEEDCNWATTLAEKMLEDSSELQNVQFSLQIHKILWPRAVGAENER